MGRQREPETSFGKYFRFLTSSSSPKLCETLGESAALNGAPNEISFAHESERDFDILDHLERGFAGESASARSVATPAKREEPLQRCCIIHSAPENSASRTSRGTLFQLFSEQGDEMLSAELVELHRIDFFLPHVEDDIAAPPRRPRFSLRCRGHDAWELVRSECEQCAQRPRHLTCAYLSRGQQLAYIKHSRCPVRQVQVHHVDVRVPSVLDDATRTGWCSAFSGDIAAPSRALSAPSLTQIDAGGSDAALPARRTSERSLGSKSTGAADAEEEPLRLRTKLPRWDDELECLVADFKGQGRSVQASPMNFMMTNASDDEGKVLFQHAKMGKNTYCLDYTNPLSAVQAFAIALVSLSWD